MRSRMLWRAWRARLRDDRKELAAIRAALRTDGIAIDVGANRGAYLYWLARWAPAGRVVAFEPQDELAEYLRAAAQAFGWPNVTIESVGVGDHRGRRELYVPGGGATPGASFSTRVAERGSCERVVKEVVRLDDYFEPGTAIDVIKVDVEGLELEVFRGAERILEESSPLLVFESENRHLESGNVADVLRFLTERGYDGHFIHRGRLVPIDRFDAAVHQRAAGERFFKDAGYCNNFILRRDPSG